MLKQFKKIFHTTNIIFMIGSILGSIVLLNLYAKLLADVEPAGWVAIFMLVGSTTLSIFTIGWVLKLRRSSMRLSEWILTLFIIIAIMLFLNYYSPQWLFDANAFLSPSRELVVDTGRSIFIR